MKRDHVGLGSCQRKRCAEDQRVHPLARPGARPAPSWALAGQQRAVTSKQAPKLLQGSSDRG
jgi:hypothetical protein